MLELISLPLCIEVKDPEHVEQLFRNVLEHSNSTDLQELLLQKAALLELLAYYISCSDVHFPIFWKDERFSCCNRIYRKAPFGRNNTGAIGTDHTF